MQAMPTSDPTPRRRVLHAIPFDIETTADWQLIPIRAVSAWAGKAQSTIYNMIREGRFPNHEEKENPGDRNAWRAGVVKAWIKGGLPAALAWRAAYAASSISTGDTGASAGGTTS